MLRELYGNKTDIARVKSDLYLHFINSQVDIKWNQKK